MTPRERALDLVAQMRSSKTSYDRESLLGCAVEALAAALGPAQLEVPPAEMPAECAACEVIALQAQVTVLREALRDLWDDHWTQGYRVCPSCYAVESDTNDTPMVHEDDCKAAAALQETEDKE